MKKLRSNWVIAAFITSSQAAVVYTESVDGEISATNTAPTNVGVLAFGPNDVIGQIGGGLRDYFTFSIPAAFTLDSITLVSGTGQNHFFGIDDQATFSDNPTDLPIATLFSGAPTESADFLETFASGGNQGGTGVTGGFLPTGNYSVLVNEFEAGPFDYTLRFTVVPEPSSALLLSLAGLPLLRRRR